MTTDNFEKPNPKNRLQPSLKETHKDYYIVYFDGNYIGTPHSIWPKKLPNLDYRNHYSSEKQDSSNFLLSMIEQPKPFHYTPNLIKFKHKDNLYGTPQEKAPIRFLKPLKLKLDETLIEISLAALKIGIDSASTQNTTNLPNETQLNCCILKFKRCVRSILRHLSPRSHKEPQL